MKKQAKDLRTITMKSLNLMAVMLCVGIHLVTLLRHETLERLNMNSHGNHGN